MSKADVSEIRRMLQVYDQSSTLPPRQAVTLLQGITAQIAKAPKQYDLLEDPDEAEAWSSAGGESYCENQEFPNLLAKRWLEVLSRPDFANAGFDEDDLDDLKDDMEEWIKVFAAAELGFGSSEELLAKLDELIEAAPEADDDDSGSD